MCCKMSRTSSDGFPLVISLTSLYEVHKNGDIRDAWLEDLKRSHHILLLVEKDHKVGSEMTRSSSC